MRSPTVSVVIPTYNSAKYLGQAIRSVLGQGHKDVQVIVIDDGSSDQTEEVVRVSGSSVDYVRQANRGPAAARNRGIEISRGEFVAFLDADDYWLPGKLDRQVGLLSQQSDVTACHTAFMVSQREGERGRVRRYWRRAGYHPSLRELLRDDCVNTSTLMMRRAALSKVGWFDETLRTSEDWNLWLRLKLSGHRLYYLPEALAVTRHHGGNLHVTAPPDTQRVRGELMLRSLWADHRERIPKVFLKNLPALLDYHVARLAFERGERARFWRHFALSVLRSPRLGLELFGAAALRRWRGWRAPKVFVDLAGKGEEDAVKPRV